MEEACPKRIQERFRVRVKGNDNGQGGSMVTLELCGKYELECTDKCFD